MNYYILVYIKEMANVFPEPLLMMAERSGRVREGPKNGRTNLVLTFKKRTENGAYKLEVSELDLDSWKMSVFQQKR